MRESLVTVEEEEQLRLRKEAKKKFREDMRAFGCRVRIVKRFTYREPFNYHISVTKDGHSMTFSLEKDRGVAIFSFHEEEVWNQHIFQALYCFCEALTRIHDIPTVCVVGVEEDLLRRCECVLLEEYGWKELREDRIFRRELLHTLSETMEGLKREEKINEYRFLYVNDTTYEIAYTGFVAKSEIRLSLFPKEKVVILQENEEKRSVPVKGIADALLFQIEKKYKRMRIEAIYSFPFHLFHRFCDSLPFPMEEVERKEVITLLQQQYSNEHIERIARDESEHAQTFLTYQKGEKVAILFRFGDMYITIRKIDECFVAHLEREKERAKCRYQSFVFEMVVGKKQYSQIASY